PRRPSDLGAAVATVGEGLSTRGLLEVLPRLGTRRGTLVFEGRPTLALHRPADSGGLRDMTQPEQLSALEHGLAEVAVALFAPGTVERVLQRIVDEAAATIEACDFAGVLHLHDGQATTAAHSDPRVLELHRLQADLHQGPCFDVVAGGADTYAADLAHDDRWPDFGPAAVAEGVRSVLAYQVISARSSALNLYSPLPAAFGVVDRA